MYGFDGPSQGATFFFRTTSWLPMRTDHQFVNISCGHAYVPVYQDGTPWTGGLALPRRLPGNRANALDSSLQPSSDLQTWRLTRFGLCLGLCATCPSGTTQLEHGPGPAPYTIPSPMDCLASNNPNRTCIS